MKRAPPERSGTSDASNGLEGSTDGTDSTAGEGAWSGGSDHRPSPAFEAWLAGYRGRLEQLVENARRK